MDFSAYDNFKIKDPYYSGYRLLSTPDRSGARPEIFVSTTNRSAGKTVFYNGWLLHQFIKTGKKFLLLFRNKYEIDNAAQNFFSQIGDLFYAGLHMTQERGIKNVFDKIYLAGPEENTETLCGYATSLRASEQIKNTLPCFQKSNIFFSMKHFRKTAGICRMRYNVSCQYMIRLPAAAAASRVICL